MALKVLREAGTKANENTVKALCQFAADEDSQVRLESVNLLGIMADNGDVNALGIIEKRLEDSDTRIRAASQLAFDQLKPKEGEDEPPSPKTGEFLRGDHAAATPFQYQERHRKFSKEEAGISRDIRRLSREQEARSNSKEAVA